MSSSSSSLSSLSSSSSSSYIKNWSSSSSSSSFLDYKDKKTLPFFFSVDLDATFLSATINNRDIYIGTAPDGMVLKSSNGNFWQTLYQTNDIRVNALYFENSLNTLYIGTGPNGYIYTYNMDNYVVNKYDIGSSVKSFAKINNNLYSVQEYPPVITLLDIENDKWDIVYELKFGILKDLKVYNNKMYMAISKGRTGNSIIMYDGEDALLVGGDNGL